MYREHLRRVINHLKWPLPIEQWLTVGESYQLPRVSETIDKLLLFTSQLPCVTLTLPRDNEVVSNTLSKREHTPRRSCNQTMRQASHRRLPQCDRRRPGEDP
jgi:hypothetical protein